MARSITDWSPESEKDYELASKELKRRFAQWRHLAGAVPDEDPGEAPIHYKWAYMDGHLTRWTRNDLSEVYLELHPAKVIIDDDDLGSVLEEARSFIRFLDETELLDPDSDPADVLIDHLGVIEEQFLHNMSDDSLYSFGKRLWMTARSEGVDFEDRESVDAFIADFNSRPLEQRDTILGPRFPSLRPKASGRFTPPGTRPRTTSSKRHKRRR